MLQEDDALDVVLGKLLERSKRVFVSRVDVRDQLDSNRDEMFRAQQVENLARLESCIDVRDFEV
jgi:hypothetical protein